MLDRSPVYFMMWRAVAHCLATAKCVHLEHGHYNGIVRKHGSSDSVHNYEEKACAECKASSKVYNVREELIVLIQNGLGAFAAQG